MPPTEIRTSAAPPPLPFFSQAVSYGGMIYCSGNIGIDPAKEFKPIDGTVGDRTVCIFLGIFLLNGVMGALRGWSNCFCACESALRGRVCENYL